AGTEPVGTWSRDHAPTEAWKVRELYLQRTLIMRLPTFDQFVKRALLRGMRAARRRRGPGFKPFLQQLEDRTVLSPTAWQGPNNGLWSVPGNWTNGVPTTGSDVTVNNGTTAVEDITVEVNTLTLGSSSGLSLNGPTLTIDTASTLNGTVTFGPNGSLVT